MGHLINQYTENNQCHVVTQRGVAMVEFLISVPVLLMLFAAVIEFGIMFYTQTTLNKAVQDGVRYLAGRSVYGQLNFTEIRPQVRTEAINLVVYGNIWANGNPLIENFDPSMVEVNCLYGTTATATGSRCTADASNNLISPFYVRAQFQYVPAFGGMLSGLTGVNISIPLQASAINLGF